MPSFIRASRAGRDAEGSAVPGGQAERLSPREADVLTHLAQMMSTEEIAAELCLSPNTVKTHLQSIYRKLGVARRAEEVRRAWILSILYAVVHPGEQQIRPLRPAEPG